MAAPKISNWHQIDPLGRHQSDLVVNFAFSLGGKDYLLTVRRLPHHPAQPEAYEFVQLNLVRSNGRMGEIIFPKQVPSLMEPISKKINLVDLDDLSNELGSG